MEFTQRYAKPSGAALRPDGMRLEVSAEQSRPGVFLDAMVKESLSYARVMLALYEVVSGDLRSRQKDHSAYQEWVQQRYLEELPDVMAQRMGRQPALLEKREALSGRIKTLQEEARRLERSLQSADFYQARQKYFNWLYTHDKEAWWVLDPVVSVHPDSLIFEVFSQDESSYGRVTVPTENLDIFGKAVYGTTNIDFSRTLADEIRRVRSYRPAFLQIGAQGVTLATGAGEAIEKKIDLPPSWVRGFLQVQSAATFHATALTLSASVVAEILAALRAQRETVGPRSLRFALTPGEKPVITIEPWQTAVREPHHVYTGDYRGDIRLWGRRRLLALESLMPHADTVEVRLLGTGMPSYWSVTLGGHRFDLGLSGWTRNDWAQAARFDLLATITGASTADTGRAALELESRLRLTPQELADRTGQSRDTAAAALQQLCADGRAMYDPSVTAYRWRPLMPFPVKFDGAEDKRLVAARKIVTNNGVKWRGAGDQDEDAPVRPRAEKTVRLRAFVKAEKQFRVTLDVDRDGRVQYAECNCSWHRRNRLRQGPCAHLLAASALASQQVAAQILVDSDADDATPSARRFDGMTFVFTGALSLFTREQAEAIVKQQGGTASGSVSKNTTYLVAGDKAGSKLTKAQQLNVPVLTEAQFKAMLEGKQNV